MPVPQLDTFLAGYWVGSSSGFIHDLPPDTGLLIGQTTANRARPPHLAAYYRIETERRLFPLFKPSTIVTWEQTEGYYMIAALLRLKIEPASATGSRGPVGSLSGFNWVNRGGHRRSDSEINGTYELFSIGNELIEGDFNLVLVPPPPATLPPQDPPEKTHPIELNLHWIARNLDEIEWLCRSVKKGDDFFRGNVGQGTLKRVAYK